MVCESETVGRLLLRNILCPTSNTLNNVIAILQAIYSVYRKIDGIYRIGRWDQIILFIIKFELKVTSSITYLRLQSLFYQKPSTFIGYVYV